MVYEQSGVVESDKGRMNIIGTGLSGLVGSRIVTLLSPSYQFANLSLETGVDITNHEMVASAIAKSDAPWVFHLAAYTNVQEAEKERSMGDQSMAWKVNVKATENIVSAVQTSGKKLLYIDTDYAFDGTKASYTEDDAPNPLGWYATTKSEGAKRVLALGSNGLVVRIANPYRANPVGKTDFVHKMLERLTQNLGISAPSDQLFVPTFIDDIAQALDALISRDASGIYHIVGSSAISPYQAAIAIAKEFRLDESQITQTTFAQYFMGRAPIPQYAVLKNDKIQNLGVHMRTFEGGLKEVHSQESSQK
jgi:dTDP-4-dehydrorhamnose reductase